MLNPVGLRNFHPSIFAALVLCLAFPVTQPVWAQMIPADEMIHPSYILGAGDQIDISVFGYEEFTGSQVVLPDGTISLPILGAVTAAGQTPEVLAQELTARLQPYLVEPVVTVRLSALRPVVINVAGEVQRPGPIQLRSLTSTSLRDAATGSTIRGPLDSAPTVSSALIEAGGVTRNADVRQIVVRRSLPGGESTAVTVNLWDAIGTDNVSQDLILQAGDSVFVPRLQPGDMIDQRLLARSSLSPETVRVRVVGEVNSPGEVEISPDSSISAAVASAGGPTDDARMSATELLRLNEADGTIVSQRIDLRDLNDNSQVQEGDVIYVPEDGGSIFLRGLNRVLSPLGNILSIFQRITNF